MTEALRLADERKIPDHRGAFILINADLWEGEAPPCCAIGAAALISGVQPVFEAGEFSRAVFVSNEGDFHSPLVDDWDEMLEDGTPSACPAHCGYHTRWLCSQVIHLYDAHLWSRTKIADWLEAKQHGFSGSTDPDSPRPTSVQADRKDH